jgi:hypothetical protein
MRLATLAVSAFVLAAGGAALAGKVAQIGGTYPMTFKQSGNTCEQPPIDVNKGDLKIEQKGTKVTVSFPMLAIMRGTVDADGSFTAKAKRGGTAVAGLQGEFKVAGTVKDGKLTGVLVASYFVKNAPYCEQSWEGSGDKQ